jgi:hypothetical protein
MRCAMATAAGIVALAMAPANLRAQEQLTEVDLSKMLPDQPPTNFDVSRTGQGGPAQWTIVKDASASQGVAIAQTSVDTTDYRFPLAIYRSASLKNVNVNVRFKAVAGKIDEAAGIAVRLVTPDDYYVVRANALEDNVNLYRVVNGRRTEIAGAKIKVAKNEWHGLAITAEDEKFTIAFDGKPLFTTTDKTFVNGGRVALWTKADSVTYFDNFVIRALP